MAPCSPTPFHRSACVRVRPAFAGEGRYFVRVAEGTNSGRAMEGGDMDLQEELLGEMATEEGEGACGGTGCGGG